MIFDNYSANPHPVDTFPTSSFSKKTPVDDNLIEGSSSKHSSQDLQELRQQLQSMKKQMLVLMEQSRRSSEREKFALQQAQDAMVVEDAAVAEATEASSRENYMLQLMTNASLDMTCMLHVFNMLDVVPAIVPSLIISPLKQAHFWILLPKINVLRLEPMYYSDLLHNMVLTFG